MSTLSDALAARDRTREAEQWNEDTESLALDWIAKALPIVKARAKELGGLLKTYKVIFQPGETAPQKWHNEWERLSAELATLTELIAQAEGKKEGE